MSDIDLVTALRQRIETEDELLNTRTTIFLATNGLWAASVGVSTSNTLQAGIAVLGIVVTVLWLISSRQSYLVIRALTIRVDDEVAAASDPRAKVQTEVREVLQPWPKWLRPTDIMARWLPVAFLLVWVALLVGVAVGVL